MLAILTYVSALHCKICLNLVEDSIKCNDGRIFHHCSNCKFTFLDDTFRLDADSEKARYELHENSIEDQAYVKFLTRFIDYAVKPYLEKGMSILDYGSGPEPVLAELLRRHGYEVDIYDSFYSKNKPSLTYDMIVSTEVFEHFYEPTRDFEFIISLLKPGAYLSVMTSLNPGLDKFIDWWYKNDPTHVSIYDKKTFEFIANEHKLKLLESNSKDMLIFQHVNKNAAQPQG